MVVQPSAYVKNHRFVHFKMVNFIVLGYFNLKKNRGNECKYVEKEKETIDTNYQMFSFLE